MTLDETKAFLDEKHDLYNRPSYIETDPIQVPHRFSKKEDIEIAAFFTATIAWGQRKSITKNANLLMTIMENSPFDFVKNSTKSDLQKVIDFKHRTFNGFDCMFFIEALQDIYSQHNGLEAVFTNAYSKNNSVRDALIGFRRVFMSTAHLPRSRKHLSDVTRNSAAKRLNMFLRWMVRNDNRGVDFGLWRGIRPADLYIPLDVHSGNVSRKLGLLARRQNDWKAVEELNAQLRQFDATDPVKYDYALFGLGVFEGF